MLHLSYLIALQSYCLSPIHIHTHTHILPAISKMKNSIILAVGCAAAFVAAQDLSALPACGVSTFEFSIERAFTHTCADTSLKQTCISNMLGQATELGCSASDYSCLCNNENFGYGVRDCSNEACGNASDAATVISFGTAFCQRMYITHLHQLGRS